MQCNLLNAHVHIWQILQLCAVCWVYHGGPLQYVSLSSEDFWRTSSGNNITQDTSCMANILSQNTVFVLLFKHWHEFCFKPLFVAAGQPDRQRDGSGIRRIGEIWTQAQRDVEKVGEIENKKITSTKTYHC